MRFSLRTLVLVMLLGGPALAGAWLGWKARLHYLAQWEAKMEQGARIRENVWRNKIRGNAPSRVPEQQPQD